MTTFRLHDVHQGWMRLASLLALLLVAICCWYAPAAGAQPPSTQAVAGDRIVARIGRDAITLGELRDEARFRRLQGVMDRDMGDMLVELINRRTILVSWPDNRGIPPEVRAQKAEHATRALNNLENDLGGRDAMIEALSLLGWNRQQFMAFAEARFEENYKIRQLILRQMNQPKGGDAPLPDVTPDDLGVIYDVSQIFFSYRRPLEGRQAELTPQIAARERALAALNRLDRGEAFPTLARLISEDPATAVVGGRIGEMRETEMAEAFASTLRSMAPGETSLPVVGEDGVRLLRLNARQTPESRLNARRFLAARAALLTELRKDFPIEMIDLELQRTGIEQRVAESEGTAVGAEVVNELIPGQP